jgi:hypothetical protein
MTMPTIECIGTLRGYLCTQCLDNHETELIFEIVMDGDRNDPEYICPPCMDAILDGTREITKLRIVIE